MSKDADKQEKIRLRFEQTYSRLEKNTVKELEKFLKDGKAKFMDETVNPFNQEETTFRLSNTDRTAIYKLIQLKKFQKNNSLK